MSYNYLDHVCKRFKNCDFENYKVNEANKKAYEACKSFCSNITKNLDEGNNLLICGNVGTGKTHLAYAIKRELVTNQNISDIVITDMMELIKEIKSSFNNGGKFEDYSRYQQSLTCNLLIIDEIGVQYGTEAERIMMYELFNKRYCNMRPIIGLGNLDKPNLQKILGQRITDRLCGGSEYFFINDKSNRN